MARKHSHRRLRALFVRHSSWLARSNTTNDDQNRDPQEQDGMRLGDEDDQPVVASIEEGMPTQTDLRTMSVEKMQEVLRAINKRLPEAMRVDAEEPVKEGKRRTLLEDVLGYSSSTRAPHRPSLSILSTPTSPLTKDRTNSPSHLAAPAPLQSPSFVLLPESPCCDQSLPTRNAHSTISRRFSPRMPVSLPDYSTGTRVAEQSCARESPMRNPFVLHMSDDHVTMMTATPRQTKRSTLDPVEEEAHAEDAETKKYQENEKTSMRVKRHCMRRYPVCGSR